MIPAYDGIKNYTRPPFAPWYRDGWVCLDKNEPPFPAFNNLEESLAGCLSEDLRTYPDPYKLYIALSEYLDLDPEQLLITFGSEQAIRFAFESILNPGDEVVYPHPTFAMIDVFALNAQARIDRVEYKEGLQLDAEQFISRIKNSTRLVFLANPNNPTGTFFSTQELDEIVKKARDVGAAVLLDEAYFHYSEITGISLIKKYENLIITRTFSKAWGLAGIRVGYAISNPENISQLRKLKPIDEISSLSMHVCLNALLNHNRILGRNVGQATLWKRKFQKAFPHNVPISEGNFVLFRFDRLDQFESAMQWFKENRILVKGPFPEKALRLYTRFSIGSDSTMEAIFQKLPSFT